MRGFDPEFDDAQWTVEWADVPIVPVPAGRRADGYEIIERRLARTQILGRIYEAAEPFAVRALLDPAGRLWMSDTPQERMMMFNNARRSRGHVLVGGLGLAMYPQYAAASAERFTIVEHSGTVIDIAGVVLEQALARRSPPVRHEIVHDRIEDHLAIVDGPLYDTIFLDTWETLDAGELPRINRLRDAAVARLAPGGVLLLWGYRWMVRLYEDACRRLLGVPPADRAAWLESLAQPQAAALLGGVLAHFNGINVVDVDQAMIWCRGHVTRLRSPGR
jgi:hypothetical protein